MPHLGNSEVSKCTLGSAQSPGSSFRWTWAKRRTARRWWVDPLRWCPWRCHSPGTQCLRWRCPLRDCKTRMCVACCAEQLFTMSAQKATQELAAVECSNDEVLRRVPNKKTAKFILKEIKLKQVKLLCAHFKKDANESLHPDSMLSNFFVYFDDGCHPHCSESYRADTKDISALRHSCSSQLRSITGLLLPSQLSPAPWPLSFSSYTFPKVLRSAPLGPRASPLCHTGTSGLSRHVPCG